MSVANDNAADFTRDQFELHPRRQYFYGDTLAPFGIEPVAFDDPNVIANCPLANTYEPCPNTLGLPVRNYDGTLFSKQQLPMVTRAFSKALKIGIDRLRGYRFDEGFLPKRGEVSIYEDYETRCPAIAAMMEAQIKRIHMAAVG